MLKGGHVETLEEDLACAFVCVRREAGEGGEEDGKFVLYAGIPKRGRTVLPVVVMLIVYF
jgi:hypothetical protein